VAALYPGGRRRGQVEGQAQGPAPTLAAGTFSESMRQGPSFVGATHASPLLLVWAMGGLGPHIQI